MGKSLKKGLKELILPLAAILTLGACALCYSGEETFQRINKWGHHYQKISGLFTKTVFTSADDGQGRVHETFYRYNFFKGGMAYRDLNLDGTVDEITIFSRFKRERTYFTMAQHYSGHKPEFDEATKRFTELRRPYITRMEKLLAK